MVTDALCSKLGKTFKRPIAYW